MSGCSVPALFGQGSTTLKPETRKFHQGSVDSQRRWFRNNIDSILVPDDWTCEGVHKYLIVTRDMSYV